MTTSTSLLHSFSDDKNIPLVTPVLFIILVVFVILGAGTGYLLAKSRAVNTLGNSQNNSAVRVGSTYGSNDSSFKDTAEGVLQSGGIDGEGQYHLVRSGGDSQNVYLTSSTVDLSQFLGHKIKVFGQTQQAQHAGWLMDVGRVEVES